MWEFVILLRRLFNMIVNPLIVRKRWKRLVPVIGPIQETPGNYIITDQEPFVRKPAQEYPLMAQVSMSDSQQVVLSVVGKDKKGNPADLTGTLQWSVDNPNVVAVNPATDNKSCTCVAVGPLGTATVTVKETDDQGNTLAAGTCDFTITAGPVSTIEVTPGAPTDQP